MMILGIGILDWGIITEIDGIGRLAMLLFGTMFTIIACIIPFEKQKENRRWTLDKIIWTKLNSCRRI